MHGDVHTGFISCLSNSLITGAYKSLFVRIVKKTSSKSFFTARFCRDLSCKILESVRVIPSMGVSMAFMTGEMLESLAIDQVIPLMFSAARMETSCVSF